MLLGLHFFTVSVVQHLNIEAKSSMGILFDYFST